MRVSSIALATDELIKETSDVLQSFRGDVKLPNPAIEDDEAAGDVDIIACSARPAVSIVVNDERDEDDVDIVDSAWAVMDEARTITESADRLRVTIWERNSAAFLL